MLPQEVCVKERVKSHEPSSGLRAQLLLWLVCLRPRTPARDGCPAPRGRHLEPRRTWYGASAGPAHRAPCGKRCKLGTECSRTEVEDVEIRVIHQVEFITHSLFWRRATEAKQNVSVSAKMLVHQLQSLRLPKG